MDRIFAAVSPAATDNTDAIHTAGRISKALCAPSAARTLDCYRASADFLRGIADMDLTGMITGTVAESDPLLTPRMKGKISDVLYWRQISHEDRCRVRWEMLSAAPGDLAALAGPVEELASRGSVCILGSRQQVDACAGWLDKIMVL